MNYENQKIYANIDKNNFCMTLFGYSFNYMGNTNFIVAKEKRKQNIFPPTSGQRLFSRDKGRQHLSLQWWPTTPNASLPLTWTGFVTNVWAWNCGGKTPFLQARSSPDSSERYVVWNSPSSHLSLMCSVQHDGRDPGSDVQHHGQCRLLFRQEEWWRLGTWKVP